MKDTKEWNDKFRVKIYETDNLSRVKMSSIFNYLQETATNHAVEAGVGHELLKNEHNLFFALSKIKVKIFEFPRWNDNLEVTTWVSDETKITVIRDFLVKKNGKDIMYARSVWALVDLEDRKPVTIDNLPIEISINDELPNINENLKGIKAPNEMNYIYTKEIRFSDIDLNKHFNNALYLDVIMDAFDEEFLNQNIIQEIQVNYIRELKYLDKIDLYTADYNGYTVVKGQSSQLNCFVAKIKWMKY